MNRRENQRCPRRYRGLLLGATAAVVLAAACNVAIEEGDAPGEVVVRISNQVFGIEFGIVGVFDVAGGSAAIKRAAFIPLFDQDPVDRPATAQLLLPPQRVQAVAIGSDRTATGLGTPAGTATIRVGIADGAAEDPCATATDAGAFSVTFGGGDVEVRPAGLDVPDSVLPALISGRFTMCLEVSSTVDVQVVIEGIDISFGPAIDDFQPDSPDDGAGDPVVGDEPGTPGDDLLMVPIDELGMVRTATEKIDGIDYALSGDVLAAHTPDAPTALVPDRVPIDLMALGLEHVAVLYFGTHSAWAMDLPNGLTVATLTCEYAEGGPPTTLNLVTGSNTAEWSYERIEHTEFYGGVQHARPPELLSWTSTESSRAAYTGYTYAGMLRLDTSRTLTCVRLELDPDVPYIDLRNVAVNPVPTWFGHAISTMTLAGPAGVPATLSSGCSGAVDDDGGRREVPIDEFGSEIMPNDEIAGIDYYVTSDEGIMEVTSSDATAARWPDMISIDLAELGLANVEEAYFGTFSSWAPDLPGGLTVATLTFDYAEGGPATTVDLVTGSTTAEWSYGRIEHLELLGGVRHARPSALLEYTSSLGSRAPYTAYVYSGHVTLDARRTLTCIKLALAAGAPFAGVRDESNPVPTWVAQTMSAITLVGPEGSPATPAVRCDGAGEQTDDGFTVAEILRAGAEHVVAGAAVDPAVSARTPAGYGPVDIAVSGDGQIVWFVLYDQFPDIEGDPIVQLWSVRSDGTDLRRVSISNEDANPGTDTRFVRFIETTRDGDTVVINDSTGTIFWQATQGGATNVIFDSGDAGPDRVCPRGAFSLSDDGGTIVFSDFCNSRVGTAATSGGGWSFIADREALGFDGFNANGWSEFSMDMAADASKWMIVPRVPISGASVNPILIGTGVSSSPAIEPLNTPADIQITSWNMTDDGNTVGYCELESIFDVSDCYVQDVGSAERQVVTDGLSALGNMVLADDGSKVYARAGFGFDGGWGFMQDLATGQTWPSGSQRFSGKPTPVFVDAEMSDDGTLLAAPVVAGVYVLHDDNQVPAGFPTLERILYRINEESCSMTVRVEVNAPLGVERIFTLPIYEGFEPTRTLEEADNPLYGERSGGGVNLSTVFTDLGGGVWERDIALQTLSGCKRGLLDDAFQLRIVLVEATASRTAFYDFSPVP